MNKENLEKITELRHILHSEAELSGREKNTKEILMKFMKDHTDFEVIDRGSWFYCRKDPVQVPSAASAALGTALGTDSVKGADPRALSGQKFLPPIAFRADMDALPIDETLPLPYASRTPHVSHKCGHDGHSCALAGLGLKLTGKDLKRPVILIFQHAEETGKGGEVCSKLIPELGISEIYAFHNLGGYPEGSIVVRDGLSQPASKGLTVHFHGKASHASDPGQGHNPSDAVCDLEIFIRGLLQKPHCGMVLCTIVQIDVGKKDFGVSAGEGEISMTLRAENEEEMDRMEAAIREQAEKMARRDGLTCVYEVSDPFPETRNHKENLEKVASCAGALGFPVIHMKKLWRASEDFGWYLKKCPGAIFYVGNGEDYPPLHTCGYDFNDRILERAVDLFTALAQS